MKQTPELWKATYEAKTADELADAYQKWAGYYDRDKMLELEASSKWELQELREADYLINEEVTAKFCTYKVLADSN